MKKGQITIFIILGILLLLLTGVAIYFSSHKTPTVQRLFLDSRVITDQVNQCLAFTARNAMYQTLAQSGYLNPLGDPTLQETGDLQPAHYYLEDDILSYVVNEHETALPTLDSITTRIQNQITSRMHDCLNFTEYEHQGYTITFPRSPLNPSPANTPLADIHVTARLGADVVITAEYPLTFTRDQETISLHDFSTTTPLRLALLHKIASALLTNIAHAHGPYLLAQHCAEYAPADKLINIYLVPTKNKQQYALEIVDAEPTLRGEIPLRFQFALRNVQIFGGCVQ